MDADAEVTNLEVSGAGCQVLGRLKAFQAWRKLGIGGWRGHISLFRSHFQTKFLLIKNKLY